MIFNLLQRKSDPVYYYQSKGGTEIDFIVKKDSQYFAIEVKEQAHQSDVNKTKKIAEKLGIKEYFIVSNKYAPFERVVYPFQF